MAKSSAEEGMSPWGDDWVLFSLCSFSIQLSASSLNTLCWMANDHSVTEWFAGWLGKWVSRWGQVGGEIKTTGRRERVREGTLAMVPTPAGIYWTAPCTQHCAKCFHLLWSQNPHNNPRGVERVCLPFYTRRKWGLEEGSWLKDTPRVCGKVRINSQETKA